MEKQFWEEKWQTQELGFHLPFVHPILKRNLAAFDLPAGAGAHAGLTVLLAGVEVTKDHADPNTRGRAAAGRGVAGP